MTKLNSSPSSKVPKALTTAGLFAGCTAGSLERFPGLEAIAGATAPVGLPPEKAINPPGGSAGEFAGLGKEFLREFKISSELFFSFLRFISRTMGLPFENEAQKPLAAAASLAALSILPKSSCEISSTFCCIFIAVPCEIPKTSAIGPTSPVKGDVIICIFCSLASSELPVTTVVVALFETFLDIPPLSAHSPRPLSPKVSEAPN